MPRSKLALNVPIKKLFSKEKINPTLELLKLFKEVDEKGKPLLDAKTRATIMLRLQEYQYSKPKSHEVIGEQDRKIEISRLTYTMPETNGSTVIDVMPSQEPSEGHDPV